MLNIYMLDKVSQDMVRMFCLVLFTSLVVISDGMIVSPTNQHSTDDLYSMIQQLNATLVKQNAVLKQQNVTLTQQNATLVQQEIINKQQSATIQSLLQKYGMYIFIVLLLKTS